MMEAIYRIRRRAAGHAQDEAGFTMVEMVIAIFIFAMVITGVGVGMSSALNLTRQNRNRSIAANLAAQQMDTIRSTDFETLDQMTQLTQPTTITPTPTVEGVPYTMTQNTHWVRKNATGAAAGPCQSPPTAANPLAYIAVTTTVTWADMHGVLPVQTDTVVSPPVGVYDQTEGHIRVTVLNAASQPVSGTIVTISNPSAGVSDTATTGADGCAFFAYQPAGAYTVTLSSGVGKVDGQGNATPLQNVTVKSASTSTVQFVFDTAATLALTLSSISGYTVPSAVPVSLGNTALQPTGVLSYSGSGSLSLDPEPVPLSIRIPGVGGKLFGCRPARGEPPRRPVLLGRHPRLRDRHDAGGNEQRNDRPAVDEPAVQAQHFHHELLGDGDARGIGRCRLPDG